MALLGSDGLSEIQLSMKSMEWHLEKELWYLLWNPELVLRGLS
jgi:hypothetical protein